MAKIYPIQRFDVLADRSATPACGLPRCSLCGTLCDTSPQRVRLRRNEALVRSGDRYAGMHAIRVGSCKSVVTTADGREQVLGYHLQGESLGAEALVTRVHAATITALEDTEICAFAAEIAPRSERELASLLAPALASQRRMIRWLGAMRSEERLAAFLVDLSDRYRALGYSAGEFVLRLTREEIGSHLGIQQETVSRLLSRFQRDGLIGVRGRTVRIVDGAALRRLAG